MRARTVIIGLIVALGVLPPAPARAASAASFLQIGSMTLGPGMAYSCIGRDSSGSPAVDPNKCLGPFSATPNATYFTYTGTLGGGGAHAPEGTTEIGTYSVTASGVITGACDFWNATMQGWITSHLNLGTRTDPGRAFTAGVWHHGGKGIITGSTNLGETLVGEFNAAPTTGSCLDHYPKGYTTWGVIAIAGA
ncbi:MAG TPA: hypothetical protein VGB03_07845 [Acidimicrobiales bacterium]|jgi:hypothetical protein